MLTAPHNIEVERALLGALLIDNRVMQKIAAVTAAAFYDPLHAQIFEACRLEIDAGRVADPITLRGFFSTHPEINRDLSVVKYLGQLAAEATTTANASSYAETLLGLATGRKLVDIAAQIDAGARQPGRSHVETANSAVQGIDEVLAATRTGKPTRWTFEAGTADLIDTLANDDGRHRVVTGLADLDGVGFLRRGQLTILAARPSMGKSAVGADIALNVGRQNRGVLFISLEMGVRNPSHCGHRFRSIADSIPMIADSW